MKTLPYPIRNSRCIVQCALATAALFLGACSATAPVKGGTERHGQVKFSSAKEQIVEHLCGWGEEVSHNAIEVYVHRLRKKLEGGNVRIATVRGLGYSLQRSTDAEPR